MSPVILKGEGINKSDQIENHAMHSYLMTEGKRDNLQVIFEQIEGHLHVGCKQRRF